jgi:hypothetical protein
MTWPHWIVNLLQDLQTNAILREKVAACEASNQNQADEIARLKDDERRLKRHIEQLCPDEVDETDDLILLLMAGSNDDLVDCDEISEQLHANRHGILLRLEALADHHYIAWSRNQSGMCQLTRRARIYLKQKGAFEAKRGMGEQNEITKDLNLLSGQ